MISVLQRMNIPPPRGEPPNPWPYVIVFVGVVYVLALEVLFR